MNIIYIPINEEYVFKDMFIDSNNYNFCKCVYNNGDTYCKGIGEGILEINDMKIIFYIPIEKLLILKFKNYINSGETTILYLNIYPYNATILNDNLNIMINNNVEYGKISYEYGDDNLLYKTYKLIYDSTLIYTNSNYTDMIEISIIDINNFIKRINYSLNIYGYVKIESISCEKKYILNAEVGNNINQSQSLSMLINGELNTNTYINLKIFPKNFTNKDLIYTIDNGIIIDNKYITLNTSYEVLPEFLNLTISSPDDSNIFCRTQIFINYSFIQINKISFINKKYTLKLTDTYNIFKVNNNEMKTGICFYISPDNAYNHDIFWKTNNNKIAYINNNNIVMLRKGKCTITVVSSANNKITASCDIIII